MPLRASAACGFYITLTLCATMHENNARPNIANPTTDTKNLPPPKKEDGNTMGRGVRVDKEKDTRQPTLYVVKPGALEFRWPRTLSCSIQTASRSLRRDSGVVKFRKLPLRPRAAILSLRLVKFNVSLESLPVGHLKSMMHHTLSCCGHPFSRGPVL